MLNSSESFSDLKMIFQFDLYIQFFKMWLLCVLSSVVLNFNSITLFYTMASFEALPFRTNLKDKNYLTESVPVT